MAAAGKICGRLMKKRLLGRFSFIKIRKCRGNMNCTPITFERYPFEEVWSDLKPAYQSLWLMRDHLCDNDIDSCLSAIYSGEEDYAMSRVCNVLWGMPLSRDAFQHVCAAGDNVLRFWHEHPNVSRAFPDVNERYWRDLEQFVID
jgi:hypothetical protein